jgi:hypothetical protein
VVSWKSKNRLIGTPSGKPGRNQVFVDEFSDGPFSVTASLPARMS